MKQEQENSLVLPQDLRLRALAKWLKSEKPQLLSGHILDFSQVENADSGILALMLNWQQNLPAGEKLLVKHFPQSLRSLLELYDLPELIQEQ